MITLTSEVKEKIVEETNKGKYDQIENIKDNEQFLYMGKFHTLEPDKMFRNKNGELMVTVKPKPISNQSYATILEKRGDSKFYDVESGICVNIAPNSFDLPFRYSNGKEAITGEVDLIYADLNMVSKLTDDIKRVYDELQEAELESRTLKIITRNTKKEFIDRMETFTFHHFCGTGLEKKYLVNGIRKYPVYRKTPKIGECFGYVGPLRLLCALNVKLTEKDGHADATFGFTPEIMREELKYPLFFCRISEDKVQEVTSGAIFQFQGNYRENARYEDFCNTPFLIDDYVLLMPTDEFKLEYAKGVEKTAAFMEWMEELIKSYKAQFNWCFNDTLQEFYFKPGEAKYLASVDNDIYDVIHNKKKVLKPQRSKEEKSKKEE